MKFQVHLNDNDYFEFNKFHQLQSHYGASVIKKTRILLTVLFGILILFSFWSNGFTEDGFLNAGIYLVLLIIFQVFLKKFFLETIKANIKHLKKQGKLAYSEYSEIEFLEKSFTETTPTNKTEQSYASLERISVLDGKYIFLHTNNLMAYILPANAFRNQEEYDTFLQFIQSICPTVDFYKND